MEALDLVVACVGPMKLSAHSGHYHVDGTVIVHEYPPMDNNDETIFVVAFIQPENMFSIGGGNPRIFRSIRCPRWINAWGYGVLDGGRGVKRCHDGSDYFRDNGLGNVHDVAYSVRLLNDKAIKRLLSLLTPVINYARARHGQAIGRVAVFFELRGQGAAAGTPARQVQHLGHW